MALRSCTGVPEQRSQPGLPLTPESVFSTTAIALPRGGGVRVLRLCVCAQWKSGFRFECVFHVKTKTA